MPADFIPLLKKREDDDEVEQFVPDKDTGSIVTNIFISLGLMIVAMLITWLFIWSYEKDRSLFITIFAVVAFLYAAEIAVFIAINTDKLDTITFRIMTSSTVFFGFTFLLIAIIFMIKAIQHLRSKSQGYVSNTVRDYINN
jgi:hypothetical protein